MSANLPSILPASLIAASPEDGLRLALALSADLAKTWESSRPDRTDPAEFLHGEGQPHLDPGVLFTMQYSLIAAANSYWRA